MKIQVLCLTLVSFATCAKAADSLYKPNDKLEVVGCPTPDGAGTYPCKERGPTAKGLFQEYETKFKGPTLEGTIREKRADGTFMPFKFVKFALSKDTDKSFSPIEGSTDALGKFAIDSNLDEGSYTLSIDPGAARTDKCTCSAKIFYSRSHSSLSRVIDCCK